MMETLSIYKASLIPTISEIVINLNLCAPGWLEQTFDLLSYRDCVHNIRLRFKNHYLQRFD